MKQFDLETYNRMIAEGKTPKIVTRDGLDVRIVCTDRKHEGETIVALVNADGDESLRSYFPCGRYLGLGDNEYDLFFADTEPTYRPYKDAEECFRDAVKHGGWVKGIEPDCIGYHHIQSVSCDGVETYPLAPSYEYMLKTFVWADDGTPCGVKEE